MTSTSDQKRTRYEIDEDEPPMPSVREEAARIIGRVLKDQAYANRLLDTSQTTHPWDPRDSGLLTELVYGVLRRLMHINAIVDGVAKKGVDSIDPGVLVHLQVAVYQLIALDRVPDHAVVSEAVTLVRQQRGKAVAGFVNAMLRTLLREPEKRTIPTKGMSTAAHLSIITSHPPWLVKRYIADFGEAGARARLDANNTPAPQTLRVNPTWGTRDAWMELLQAADIEATPAKFAPEGINVGSSQGGALRDLLRDNPTASTIQDEAAQLLAHWLDPQPGDEILDACAAPGGKTTHIAALAPEASITAFDLHKHKVTLIRQAARRMSLNNIEVSQADATKPIEGSFDRILCDAPCSGLGILRRQPEIRYRRTPEDLKRLQSLQSRLLANLAKNLKPGGILLYSVCTDTDEETTQVAEAFLAAHPDFEACTDAPEGAAWRELINESGHIRTTPEGQDMDGFFAARWRKKA